MTRARSSSLDHTPALPNVMGDMVADYQLLVGRAHYLEGMVPQFEALQSNHQILLQRLEKLEGGDIQPMSTKVVQLTKAVEYLTKTTGIYGWLTPNNNYVSFLTDMNPDYIPTADEGAQSIYATKMREEIADLKRQLSEAIIPPGKLRQLEAADQRANNLHKEVIKLKEEVATLRASDTTSDTTPDTTDLEAKLAVAQALVKTMNANLTISQAQVDALQTALTVSEASEVDLRGELRTTKAELDSANLNIEAISMELLNGDNATADDSAQITSLQQVNAELSATIERLQSSGEQAKNHKRALHNAMTTLRIVQREKEELTTALGEVCRSRDSLQAQLAESLGESLELQDRSVALKKINDDLVTQLKAHRRAEREVRGEADGAVEALRLVFSQLDGIRGAVDSGVMARVIGE